MTTMREPRRDDLGLAADADRPAEPIPFVDLQAQRRRIGSSIDQAVAAVLAHGQFIMGPEVVELERRLAEFCGAQHAITCASGTDALALALMAGGVTRGDAVLCPSFTFAATAEVVALLGATPVFVDVREGTFAMDPASLDAGIATARREGLKPVAVIPVDLFGQPADYDAIGQVAQLNGLWVLADAAQSFGATYKGHKVGTIGAVTATSFYPAKPLGCYGDGGALFTNDQQLAEIVRSLRIHGQGIDKYDNVRIGINGRLDTIQAAVLLEKLDVFPEEILARNRVAERYRAGLASVAIVPQLAPGCDSVWAQYTIRIADRDRDAVAARLTELGVPTAVYYPRPLHRQTAYRLFPTAGGGLPVSERLAGEVLSLPMYPDLDEAVQARIIATIRAVLS